MMSGFSDIKTVVTGDIGLILEKQPPHPGGVTSSVITCHFAGNAESVWIKRRSICAPLQMRRGQSHGDTGDAVVYR